LNLGFRMSNFLNGIAITGIIGPKKFDIRNPKSEIQNPILARITIYRTFAPDNRIKEGNDDRSLLLFPDMNIEGQIAQRIEKLIQAEPGDFLVEVRIKPTNNVKVFLDADQGMSIDRLIQYNRSLYKDLEESSFFPGGDFSLEVSSPGLDEPLKLHRQYIKNIGRHVEVLQQDGIKREGKLVSAAENEIVVEEEKGKGKKKELVEHTIPFSNIKTTKVQIKF
jgi:ribosome maturation factor RimP